MPFIAVSHWPLTETEEDDLYRRGVIKHKLTPQERAREEARALRRDQERAIAQAERFFAARRG